MIQTNYKYWTTRRSNKSNTKDTFFWFKQYDLIVRSLYYNKQLNKTEITDDWFCRNKHQRVYKKKEMEDTSFSYRWVCPNCNKLIDLGIVKPKEVKKYKAEIPKGESKKTEFKWGGNYNNESNSLETPFERKEKEK